MANKTINQFVSGSISDSSLGLIGDPSAGALSQTSFHAMKDYFTAGITGSGGSINTGSLATTASLNALSSSYSTDSGSFNSRINSSTGSGGGVSIGTFVSYTASTNIQIANTFASESNYVLTSSFNTFSSSLSTQIINIYVSESNYVLTASYLIDSSSFNTRINSVTGSGGPINTGSLLLTSSFNTYTSSANLQIANVYASESNYHPTGSFNTYSASANIQINNVFASESNYTPTGSFNALSSSYVNDSSSFNTRINNITGSGGGVSGSFVTTGSFNTYTSSVNTQINNLYASESNYTLTSSFNTLSSSYSNDSGSFNTRINAVVSVNTSSFVTTSSFNSYTSSVQNQSLTLVDSSSILWNFSNGNIANVTIAGNRNLNTINVPSQSFGILKVIQDSTGGRTLTVSGSTPTNFGLSSGANQIDVLGFYFDGLTYFWSINNYGTQLSTLSTPSLTLGITGSSNISWSWSSVPSASNYLFQRANDSAYSNNLTTLYTGSGLSFGDTNLSSSTTYYYRVKAQAPTYNDSIFSTGNGTTSFALDVDALKYINAASIPSPSQSAVNTFVTSLKSNNLWTSMSAYYPMYGNSYATVKYNLINTGSFMLTENTSGSIIYSTAGVSSTSSTVLETNFSASLLSQSNNCFYVNVKTNVSALTVDMGSSAGDASYIVSDNGGNLWFANNCSAVTNITIASSIGRFYNSRQSSTLATIYKNGSSIGTNTNTASATAPSTASYNNFRILGANNGSNSNIYLPSTRQVSSAGMFNGFSAAQIATLDGLIATFETAIGH